MYSTFILRILHSGWPSWLHHTKEYKETKGFIGICSLLIMTAHWEGKTNIAITFLAPVFASTYLSCPLKPQNMCTYALTWVNRNKQLWLNCENASERNNRNW